MKTKLHKRPTSEGLWHPVSVKGGVGWPVNVTIIRDDDGKRHFHLYHHGSEESHGLNGYKQGTQWLRYRAPKVVR